MQARIRMQQLVLKQFHQHNNFLQNGSHVSVDPPATTVQSQRKELQMDSRVYQGHYQFGTDRMGNIAPGMQKDKRDHLTDTAPRRKPKELL
jgi:hypothetical protein